MSEKNVKEEAKTNSEKEELYEWVAENFDKIIEDVQTILHNNPNRFVSVREIAENLEEIAGKPHWPFKGYVELECICFVVTCNIKEYDFDFDSEYSGFKYKGKIADEYTPKSISRTLSKRYLEESRRIKKYCRETRDEILNECKKPRQRRKLEEGDNQAERTMKQLIKIQNEERDLRVDI
jgi:hypothetical protein